MLQPLGSDVVSLVGLSVVTVPELGSDVVSLVVGLSVVTLPELGLDVVSLVVGTSVVTVSELGALVGEEDGGVSHSVQGSSMLYAQYPSSPISPILSTLQASHTSGSKSGSL